MTFASTTYFRGFGEDYLTRSLLACAFISAAVFIVLLAPLLTEARALDGHNVWVKPQKFGVSLFVHFMTVAMAAQFLSLKIRIQRIRLPLCVFLVFMSCFWRFWGVGLTPDVASCDGAAYRPSYCPMYGSMHVCGTVSVVPTT